MQLMTSLRLPLVFGVAFLGIFSALTARGDTTYVVTLNPQREHTVLEIGSGSGYITAVLSRLVRRVYSIDRYRTLIDRARIALEQLQISRVELRLADGLDGAIARAGQKTDFGGYLDIEADFLFYGAIPLAFALRDPANAVAASFLLLSFYANGASFLGYAILAEKRGMQTDTRGQKSLYFTAGLLEGSETIGFFVAICLFPGLFPVLAWVFGGLCLLTMLARVALARRVFG